MSRTPNPGGGYVSHGRVGRAPAPRGIENAQGYTESEMAYDEMLADQYAEDLERERRESHWPANAEDQRIIAANQDWPDFDYGDYRTFRSAA